MTEHEYLPTEQDRSMIEVAESRQAQEVQAAMTVAKKFPRDEYHAVDRITKGCKRKSLAEVACYAYPRGGTIVTGPSIRLAEELARCWGNIDSGIIELEQKRGESVMMAYAWDLETNTRSTKVFTVKHERHSKKGKSFLTDPRDIYEMTANQGARRLRACILSVIPGDVQEMAVKECEKTLAGGHKEPIEDRIRAMISAFANVQVTQEMLETRLGHKIAVTTEQELANLRKIYQSITDNMAGRDQFFDVAADKPTTGSQKDLANSLKSAAKDLEKASANRVTEDEKEPEGLSKAAQDRLKWIMDADTVNSDAVSKALDGRIAVEVAKSPKEFDAFKEALNSEMDN